MKARVRATGEIIEVEYIIHTLSDGRKVECYENENSIYVADDLDFDIKEESLPENEPDYWEKLKHQYAGMAMQGILANPEMMGLDDIDVAAMAIRIANITISKLKEEEKCEK